MAVGRVGRVAVVETAGKARVGRVALTGTEPLLPNARVGRVALVGTAAVIIAPMVIPAQEPERQLTIIAALQTGGVPDSTVWRRVSGPAATLQATGLQVSLRVPTVPLVPGQAPQPGTLVLGLVAIKGGVTSPEREFSIPILPQTLFHWGGAAGFIGAPPESPVGA